MLAPCTGHVPHGVGPHPRSESGQHCWSPAPDKAHQACHIAISDPVTTALWETRQTQPTCSYRLILVF